jgi:outer membrane lipoprotein-sorting protein
MKASGTFTVAAALAAAGLGLAALPVPIAAAQTARSDLANVSAHLRAMKTMTANFSQTGQNGGTLSGKLTLARPGKIRFQYQPGVPLLVVSDGRGLFMVDYQVAQVSRWPIKNTPLGVLLDPERDPSRFARVLPSAPNRLNIEAKDPKHPEYGVMTLSFRRDPSGPAGLVLHGWTVLDAQNNRTTVLLSNQRFNVPVSDSTFRFRDPRPNRPPNKG